MIRPPRKIVGQVTAAAATKAKDRMQAPAKHLRKIFAAPILPQQVEAFQAPVFDKSDTDKDFLRSVLQDSFLFAHLGANEIDTLVGAFENYKATAKQCIIQEGDVVGDYFYILQRGKVTFHVKDKGTVGIGEPGCSFGELALLYSAPRAASVFAETDCVLWRLDQATFRKTLQAKTEGADKKKLDLLLQSSRPFLRHMDPSRLLKLARAMTRQEFQKGEYLFRKGDTANVFYLIEEGQVQASHTTIGGSKFEDQVFGPGDYLGWLAIVKQEPTFGDAQAITDCSVLVIDSKTFLTVMGDAKDFTLKPDDRRSLKSVTVIRDSCLDDALLSAVADLIVEERFPEGSAIVQEGKDTEAALYLLREGQVQVESASHGNINKTISGGGYFGEDQLLADHELAGKGEKPVISSKYTVTALEDCTVGVLKLEELRTILDTTVLGLGRDPTTSPMDKSIHMEDLTRHAMLGAGSFGQVWLASATKSDETVGAYALKVQSKYQLIETQQAEGVVSEKNIMARLCDPFIIQLVNTYQDERRVYMLTGLLQGGELASILYTSEYAGIHEDDAKFYAAGILEGLTFLHRRKIIHRDLKPQNVMINAKGYPVLIDLGFAKYVPDQTFTFCGTPIYLAPEVITYGGHDKGAYHWSLACVIYEMCTGESPFWEEDMDELDLFKTIIRGNFSVKGWMSVDLKTLLVSMFVPDPTLRLGSLAGGSKDIYNAAWFSDIDFDKIRKQEIAAPWVPGTQDPLDSSNFYDISEHVEDKFEADEPALTQEEQEVFKTF